jgi:sialic acid synthase SpsE
MTKIIAELCQNHNGDFSILKEMVHAASESGAAIVKIQSMLSKDLTHRPRFDFGDKDSLGKIKTIKRPFKTEYDRLKKLDLDDSMHYEFIELCKKYKVIAMTTIFSRSRLKFLETLNMDIIKVSSFDCSAHVLIKELADSKFKEIIVSTGCSFDDEIIKTTKILKKKKLTLMHCISIYPTPLNQINLNRINFLRSLCGSVGFSDHTNVSEHTIEASISALFYGIDYLERHFTILPQDQTKDGPVSLNPEQFKQLVRFSKISKKDLQDYIEDKVPNFELMKGKEKRKLSDIELLNRDYYRGRFASKDKEGNWIYNWEDITI